MGALGASPGGHGGPRGPPRKGHRTVVIYCLSGAELAYMPQPCRLGRCPDAAFWYSFFRPRAGAVQLRGAKKVHKTSRLHLFVRKVLKPRKFTGIYCPSFVDVF